MTVYIRDGKRFYRANVTHTWFMRHDNGAMVSCGLAVDEPSAWSGRVWISRSGLERLRKQGRLTEVAEDIWKHSGCQSRCKLRGDDICQW
jgi:hypothetical protein